MGIGEGIGDPTACAKVCALGGQIKSPNTGGKPLQRLIVMRIAGRPGGGQGSLPPKSEHNLPPEGREAQEGCHLIEEVRGTA